MLLGPEVLAWLEPHKHPGASISAEAFSASPGNVSNHMDSFVHCFSII